MTSEIEATLALATDSGTLTAPVLAGGNALPDNTKAWATNVHHNRLVKIIRGAGVGQLRVIASNSGQVLIVKQAWSVALDATSFYVIIDIDLIQILRDVFGGGADISAANPLETHDPKVEDIEDKLDHPDHGLAAIAAAIAGVAGGAFYGSYGPRNVEVDNDIDFGTILYDPAGNIITIGEITPGTYTVHRVRVAVDTEIVAAIASSEAAGRVYMTYSFPAASWNVGDIFYITFVGIQVTIDGVTTEYPNLFIWGRVVREAALTALVAALMADVGDPTGETLPSLATKWGNIARSLDLILGARWDAGSDLGTDILAIITALGALVGVTGIFHEQADAGVNASVVAAEQFIVTLNAANTRYILRDLRIKSVDPTAANTITVKLYTFINSGEVNVDSFIITNANFGTYFTLMDMFGIPHVAGDSIRVSLTGSAAGPYVVTGQYSHGKTNV